MADYPAFLFYPEDFSTGTADMSPLECGIYIRCLCHQWHKGGIPDDETKVSRIVGATSEEMKLGWPAVRSKFRERDGQLQNVRLEKIRAELKAKSKVRSASGKAGADARWADGKRNGKRMRSPMAKRRQTDDKHMASRVEDEDVNEDVSETISAPQQTHFDVWWQSVHVRVGRGAAKPAYAKAVARLKIREADPHAYLLDRMRAFAASPASKPPDRTPIHPTTWLNQDRFDDDPATWQQSARGAPARNPNDPRGNLALRERMLSQLETES